MPGIDDLLNIGRFMGKLAMGDKEGAMAVIREEPGGKCEACEKKTHKEGDPACSARDGRFHCIAHGPDGACVMGEEPHK